MAGKEYTTAPILVNADGHPIPQYLDITDTTDSPQGTFKPLTQLQAEHPDVQNVQLTGSIVEVVSDDSRYTISPGSSYEIFGGMCLYRKLRGTIRFVQDTPESELEINANLYVNGDFAGRAVVDVQKIASAHYFYEFENYSSELILRVINNAEAEKTIRNHSLVGVI